MVLIPASAGIDIWSQQLRIVIFGLDPMGAQSDRTMERNG
jgi:hypothetical protein